MKTCSSRASSTKTRIETAVVTSWDNDVHTHQEQVPRKQGLKLDGSHEYEDVKYASRASSTKTRIETVWWSWSIWPKRHIKSKFHENKDWNYLSWSCMRRCTYSSRASSTKTRIETQDVWYQYGVRRNIKSKFHENKDWNMATRYIHLHHNRHQEQVPRKQGLKHMWILDMVLICGHHQEQVPRKQGLKLRSGILHPLLIWASRASSTKTRIET